MFPGAVSVFSWPTSLGTRFFSSGSIFPFPRFWIRCTGCSDWVKVTPPLPFLFFSIKERSCHQIKFGLLLWSWPFQCIGFVSRRNRIFFIDHSGVYIMQVNHIISPPLSPRKINFASIRREILGVCSLFCLIFSLHHTFSLFFSPSPIYFPCWSFFPTPLHSIFQNIYPADHCFCNSAFGLRSCIIFDLTSLCVLFAKLDMQFSLGLGKQGKLPKVIIFS